MISLQKDTTNSLPLDSCFRPNVTPIWQGIPLPTIEKAAGCFRPSGHIFNATTNNYHILNYLCLCTYNDLIDWDVDKFNEETKKTH